MSNKALFMRLHTSVLVKYDFAPSQQSQFVIRMSCVMYVIVTVKYVPIHEHEQDNIYTYSESYFK